MVGLFRTRSALMLMSTAVLVVGCGDDPSSQSRLRRGTSSAGTGTAAVQGRVSGTGTSGLRVREKPTTASTQLGTLAEGAAVTITCRVDGETIEGSPVWDYLEAERGYVADAFIDTDAPAESIPRCDPSSAPAPPPEGEGPVVTIEGPPVQPHVQFFANEACRLQQACRATTREGHSPSADLALDFPISEGYGKLPTDNYAFGDRVAAFAISDMAKYRIEYVIFRQRINSGDGWEDMDDRGGITENHLDHVHVTFLP